MPHLRNSHRLCAILISLVATACVGASAPLPAVASVALTLNRTSLRLSDTLVLKVVGTNTSDRTIEVPNYPCLAKLDARNERDEPVALGDPMFCILPLYPPTVLAPGATWGETVRITHAAPGQYKVRAGLPLSLGTGDYVYSAFTTVTVMP